MINLNPNKKTCSVLLFLLTKKITLFCYLCFCSASFFSQDINIFNFNVKNGLSTNSVEHVFKDRYGFYWISTDLGIAKYDGYEIKKITPNPEDKIDIGNVTVIYDYFTNGRYYLIIGCDNGIVFYDYLKNKFFKDKIKILDKQIEINISR